MDWADGYVPAVTPAIRGKGGTYDLQLERGGDARVAPAAIAPCIARVHRGDDERTMLRRIAGADPARHFMTVDPRRLTRSRCTPAS